LTSFSSYTSLFSFARHSSQISPSLINITSSDYTSSLWDGDVGLVIYISDLKPRMNFRVTTDQNDLMFLVYFFLTFLACFTVLLVAFFFGWYIKRKIEVRALIRAQHIEMQRRVRRPFTRVKTLIEKRPLTRTKQNASYIAVETVRDTKAAILTLMIRFPFDRQTGHPRPNRTGICFGSTFVKMNSSKNKDKKSSLHLSS
jgi:Fanconi anemia group I protein